MADDSLSSSVALPEGIETLRQRQVDYLTMKDVSRLALADGLIRELLSALTAALAQVERAHQERDKEYAAGLITDFERHDHDREGAALAWYDCYLEQKAHAKALQEELQRMRAAH